MGYKEVATFILSTSIMACGNSRVGSSQIEATPTLTPSPSQNTFTIESTEDNLHLGIPGAIGTQMVSTAVAADLENFQNKELINPKAVNSLVSIFLVTDGGLIEASGNLAILFGHPVILTSGHVFGHADSNGLTVQRLSVKRLNIPNPVTLSFYNYKEAHIYNAQDDYVDIGVIAITDPAEAKYLIDAIGVDQMLTIDDLRFDPIESGESVTGICYPSPTYPYPYPFSGTVDGSWNSQVIIEDALTAPRCSGGGLFDSVGRYFASVSGGYDFNQFGIVSQDRWDDTFVFPLSAIGKDGLELLINQAVTK